MELRLMDWLLKLLKLELLGEVTKKMIKTSHIVRAMGGQQILVSEPQKKFGGEIEL